MAAFVYLLRCADGTFYCGWSTDPERRLRQHQAGTASRYTRRRLPVELVYTREFETRSEAMREEIRIKRLPRAQKRALATDNLDVDLGDADFIADSEDLAKITVSAESRDGKPVFVGIARTSDVERYLAGVPYTTVNDIDVDPFSADYERHSGHRHPVSPENAGIWVDSSQGTGKQTINPKLDDGDYSVVVMNADGSLGVDADVSAGAKIPFLDELAWSAIGSGAFALILGIGLIALAARKTRTAIA